MMGVAMRGTGLTKDMVMALPDGGAAVIVHSADMRDYVLRMVRDLRGIELAKRCKMIVLQSHRDLAHLQGLRVPVYVDHAFFDAVSWLFSREVHAYVDRINAAFPAPA